MARPRKSVPAYRLHKPSGQAVVSVSTPDGRRREVYLGTFNCPASIETYTRIIADLKARGRHADVAGTMTQPTINEVMLAFVDHAERYYRDATGAATSELADYRYSLKPLKKLYGSTSAADFGPLKLKALRQHMIGLDWCRRVINQRIGRIKRMFKWAVSEQLIPSGIHESLRTVEGLRRGRSDARETAPVKPVPDAHVDAVLPYVSWPIRGLIELQRVTGMRPGEACSMRASDIEMSGDVWLYRPTSHKTTWLGKERIIPLGPKARAIVKNYMTTQLSAPLFSPRRERDERFARLRAARKSKVQPSQVCRKKKLAEREPGEQYDVVAYGRAIRRGISRANREITARHKRDGLEAPKAHEMIPEWSPNRLRHNRGTEIRRRYGLEGAQVILGHAHAAVTEVYAERDLALAMKIASEVG